MIPDRLTWIDETNRGQYHFIGADDRILFFGDFRIGKGWRGGNTNQLIANYKRTPGEIISSANPTKLQRYKDRAVSEIAAALRKTFAPEGIANRTFVPIPPSKTPDDPDYCDRLERTLRLAFAGWAADIRPLLRQTVSTDADHRSGARRSSYDELLAITQIDKAHAAKPPGAELVLFDDVLTSGKHYTVAKTRVLQAFPGHTLLGIFVARSIHRNPFDAFANLDASD